MGDVAIIAEQLRANVEAVCRRYLSNGFRSGNYWMVGNYMNERGQSMYVRLNGPTSGPQARGKWTDNATGEYGDLLDLITLQNQFINIADALDEARHFLMLPHPPSGQLNNRAVPRATERTDTIARARKLFHMSQPIAGTLAETYLKSRSIIVPVQAALRFHANAYYRDKTGHQCQPPALLAAIRTATNKFTGVNKIWLKPDGSGVADIMFPKKVQGSLNGNAVWFGHSNEIQIVGEGVETILALKTVRPDIAMAAALTANHLAAFEPPADLKFLVIARDNDRAGAQAASRLSARMSVLNIQTTVIVSRNDDFNTDLKMFGTTFLKTKLSQVLHDICVAA